MQIHNLRFVVVDPFMAPVARQTRLEVAVDQLEDQLRDARDMSDRMSRQVSSVPIFYESP